MITAKARKAKKYFHKNYPHTETEVIVEHHFIIKEGKYQKANTQK